MYILIYSIPDRHLIAEHAFDYCQVCFLIGPISRIRMHILDKHHDKKYEVEEVTKKFKIPKGFTCYICCGSGKTFPNDSHLAAHLVSKHGLKTGESPVDR